MTFDTLRQMYQHSIGAFRSHACSSLYGGESLTYGAFADRVDSLVETFVSAGLSSGDRIALLSNNMPNWGVVYFAAVVSGKPRRSSLPTSCTPKCPRRSSRALRWSCAR